LVIDSSQIWLAVKRQVCSFWQVLANQSIHVFVEASLPRAVRVTIMYRIASVVAQLLVIRHLTTFVVGHAEAHGLCNAEQLICKAKEHVGRASRLGLWRLDQHHHATGALVSSTKMPTALGLASPLIKSPSQ
jgi:hypothetical protein